MVAHFVSPKLKKLKSTVLIIYIAIADITEQPVCHV